MSTNSEPTWDFSELPERLYTVLTQSVTWDEPDWDDPEDVAEWAEHHHGDDRGEPDGWREYAKNHPTIPDDADFFLPKPKLFRSRSAAKRQLQMITRWGVEAQIVECTPRWEAVPDANARRAWERSQP